MHLHSVLHAYACRHVWHHKTQDINPSRDMFTFHCFHLHLWVTNSPLNTIVQSQRRATLGRGGCGIYLTDVISSTFSPHDIPLGHLWSTSINVGWAEGLLYGILIITHVTVCVWSLCPRACTYLIVLMLYGCVNVRKTLAEWQLSDQRTHWRKSGVMGMNGAGRGGSSVWRK